MLTLRFPVFSFITFPIFLFHSLHDSDSFKGTYTV